MANLLMFEWWAWQGLNLRPLRCQRCAYSEKAQKTTIPQFSRARTNREQTRFAGVFYRRFTARIFARGEAA